jgi:hypothetical protein
MIILSFCFLNMAVAEEISDQNKLWAFHKQVIDAHKNIDLRKVLRALREVMYLKYERNHYPTTNQIRA